MATTAQTVFELAMALIDEVDSSGVVNAQNAQDYEGKAPRLISILEEDLCRRAGISLNENAQYLEYFSGNGTKTDFILSQTKITSVDSVQVFNGTTWVNVTYTVNKTSGTVTITPAPATGTQNIQISYQKSKRITSLSQNLNVTDDIAYRIMPYGLAALFLLIEDPQTSNVYNQKYETLRRQIPSSWETITDVYADGGDI